MEPVPTDFASRLQEAITAVTANQFLHLKDLTHWWEIFTDMNNSGLSGGVTVVPVAQETGPALMEIARQFGTIEGPRPGNPTFHVVPYTRTQEGS